MDWSKRVHNYGFWVSLISAVLLVAQLVAQPLGWKIDNEYIMALVNGVLGVGVVLGVISNPTTENKGYKDD
jgi:phi LC3 family holin